MQGFGFGLAFTPLMVLSFATLPRHQINEGTAVFTLVRNFGSSIFISIAVVLMVRTTAVNYARLTEFITPTSHRLILPDAWDPATGVGLARLSREILRQANMIGYINGFMLTALVAAAGILLVPLLRGIPREG